MVGCQLHRNTHFLPVPKTHMTWICASLEIGRFEKAVALIRYRVSDKLPGACTFVTQFLEIGFSYQCIGWNNAGA
jgi:hypothetical protein